jgi:hypothetical protein
MLRAADLSTDEASALPGDGRERRGAPQHLLFLDRLLPVWDATRVERRVIEAPQTDVYDAVLDADFLDAVRRNPAVRTLFAVRDIALRGEWVSLGKDWPNEVAFGAIGRFWGGETTWLATDAGSFGGFDRPGFAKIGCSIHLRALAGGRTLVSYEARTKAPDAQSRRAFMRYWRVVAPFVGVVMRAFLRTVDQAVTQPKVL